MCRHAWRLLGMLGNILGHPRHALQRPRHVCNVLSVFGMHFCKVLGNLVVHYSLGFTAYKAASWRVFGRSTPVTFDRVFFFLGPPSNYQSIETRSIQPIDFLCIINVYKKILFFENILSTKFFVFYIFERNCYQSPFSEE